MMKRVLCTTSWKRAPATWSQPWLSWGSSTPSSLSFASSATTVSRHVEFFPLRSRKLAYIFGVFVWDSPVLCLPNRFLWLSLRERRSLPESWSLMVSMSLSSLRTMTSRANGTDWCSTHRKGPVALWDKCGDELQSTGFINPCVDIKIFYNHNNNASKINTKPSFISEA